MTTAYLGTAEANAWLQEKLVDRVVWLALHIAEPTPLGDPTTEVLGGGYVRKRVLFGTPSAKASANTNNLIYTGMPACSVSWVSVWSDQYAGRMIVAIRQDGIEVVVAGGQYLGAPGDVVVQL